MHGQLASTATFLQPTESGLSQQDRTWPTAVRNDHYVTGTVPEAGIGWGLWLLRNNHRERKLAKHEPGYAEKYRIFIDWMSCVENIVSKQRL